MSTDSVWPSESVEPVYDIQRELSRLTNPAALVSTFVASLARVLPIIRIMYVLPWPPADRRRHEWIPGPEVPAGSQGYRVLLDVDKTHPPAATITLAPGDLLALCTDGIPEAFSPRQELLGLRRVAEAVDRGEDDPERTKRSVLELVDRHAAGRPRVDDQTLVVMGYRG